MTTTKAVAEKAMHLGKQLKAVIEVGEVLDEIGDLELYKAECFREAEKAENAKFKAVKDFEVASTALKAAENGLKVIKEEAKKIIDEAKQRSHTVTAAARKQHDDIMASAIKGSDAKVDEAKSEVVLLHAKRDKLLKEITDGQQAVTNLETQMLALKERLG